MVTPSQEDGMRIFVVFGLVLLAGCATPEMREAQALRQAEYMASPAYPADLSCRTKVQFAMAGFHDRSILGLESMSRANHLHAQCMDYWRRTGQMP
jgi:hypothetical protein